MNARPSPHLLAVVARLVEDGHIVTLKPDATLTVTLEERSFGCIHTACHRVSFAEVDDTHMDMAAVLHADLVDNLTKGSK